MRAIDTAKDSTALRRPSDFALHSGSGRLSTSRVIKGGESGSDPSQKDKPGSYFDIPFRTDPSGSAPRYSGPMITPKSLMAATAAETPPKDSSTEVQKDASTAESSLRTEDERQDILLVEDNEINMRVSDTPNHMIHPTYVDIAQNHGTPELTKFLSPINSSS